jgi:hypothetical protein
MSACIPSLDSGPSLSVSVSGKSLIELLGFRRGGEGFRVQHGRRLRGAGADPRRAAPGHSPRHPGVRVSAPASLDIKLCPSLSR